MKDSGTVQSRRYRKTTKKGMETTSVVIVGEHGHQPKLEQSEQLKQTNETTDLQEVQRTEQSRLCQDFESLDTTNAKRVMIGALAGTSAVSQNEIQIGDKELECKEKRVDQLKHSPQFSSSRSSSISFTTSGGPLKVANVSLQAIRVELNVETVLRRSFKTTCGKQ
jgi:hypothetical protein